MKTKQMPMGELVLLAGTRALLGAGIGLLTSPYLGDSQRKAVGWTLLLAGLLATLPLGLNIFTGDPATAIPPEGEGAA